MGRDLYEPQEPRYENGRIRWGVRGGDPNNIYEVHSSPFISCFPVENDRVFDRDHVSDVAREHWDALSEIANAAVATGGIERTVRHRNVNWRTVRINSSEFQRLAMARGFRP